MRRIKKKNNNKKNPKKSLGRPWLDFEGRQALPRARPRPRRVALTEMRGRSLEVAAPDAVSLSLTKCLTGEDAGGETFPASRLARG